MMLDQLIANIDAYTAPASSEEVQQTSVKALVAVLQQGSTSALQLVSGRLVDRIRRSIHTSCLCELATGDPRLADRDTRATPHIRR
jgi:hypothetical protein